VHEFGPLVCLARAVRVVLCCAISGCPSRYDFLVPCVFVRASGFFLFRFFCVQVFIGKD